MDLYTALRPNHAKASLTEQAVADRGSGHCYGALQIPLVEAKHGHGAGTSSTRSGV